MRPAPPRPLRGLPHRPGPTLSCLASLMLLSLTLTGCGASIAKQTPEALPTAESASVTPASPAGGPSGQPSPPLSAAPSPAGPAPTSPAPARPVPGYDVSWPQCPKGLGIPERRTLGLPMPKPDAQFVIIGLTNGPAFTPNPCLASQVAEARARNLWTAAYAIVTYPTDQELSRHGGPGADLATRLRRVGRAQAAENVAALRAVDLPTPIIWVDVEPSSVRPWPQDTALNNALIDGVIEGYGRAGYRVGLYSYKFGWDEITGARALPEHPAWVPVGKGSLTEALKGCQKVAFNGGPVAIGQSTDQVYDYNQTCPAVAGDYRSAAQLALWQTWFSR